MNALANPTLLSALCGVLGLAYLLMARFNPPAEVAAMEKPSPSALPGIGMILVALAAPATAFFPVPGWDLAAAIALAIGSVVALLVASFFRQDCPRIGFAAGAVVVGGLGGVLLAHPGAATFPVGMSAAAGFGLLGWLVARPGFGAAGAMTIVAATNLETLARIQVGEIHPAPGLLLSALLAAGFVLGASVRSESRHWLSWVVGGAAMGIAAAVVSARILILPELAMVAGVAVILTGLVVWVTETREDLSTSLLACIAMVALGSFALSETRGTGLALAGLLALGVAAVAQSRPALVAASGLIVLGTLRAMTFAFPETTRALDLGQHYTIIGLLLAMLGVLWVSNFVVLSRIAQGLATLSAVVAAIFAPMLLGSKGTLGLVLGLGLAPVLVEPKKRDAALSASTLLLSFTLMVFPLLKERLDLTRAEKLPILGGAAVVILVCAVAASALARPTSEPAQEAGASV